MFSRIAVVGRGRVGRAFAGRLVERGLLVDAQPDLVLFTVPDSAIATVARAEPLGPWVAHVSGATPLEALDPHVHRFSLHPLQTFTRARGPEQIDGAWAAATGENAGALEAAEWLARTLGLRSFRLADQDRALYHAGASIASNFLVTIYRAASRSVTEAGAPAEALVPLMQRTIENGFDLTGPIARGDWATVDAHLTALSRDLPDLVPLYRALAEATAP